jgi:hypothetical protein
MRQTFQHPSPITGLFVYLFICLFVCSTSSHSDNRMRPALRCTAPHGTAPHCTALHCTAPHCTALHRTAAAPPLQVPSPPEPKGNAMLTVSVLWQNHKYAQRT